MTLDLSGKSALVTGGGVGIGRAIVMELARAGSTVAFTYCSHDGSAVVSDAQLIGGRVTAYQLDASEPDSVNRVVQQASTALGGSIDYLINNSGGLVSRIPVREMTDEHWHRVIDLNLSSAFYVTRAVLPFMNEGGRIVNISSQAGRDGGGKGAVAYAAAKAGLDGFTRALAKELSGHAISVNSIAPGMILGTPFHTKFTPPEGQMATIAGTPLRRAGTVDDVAGTVLYLISELGSFSNGAVIDLNGGSYFG